MNKTTAVLKWLQDGHTITSLEAFERFKATRLSSIIFNLKKQGYVITTTMRTDKYGVHYAEYKLQEEAK